MTGALGMRSGYDAFRGCDPLIVQGEADATRIDIAARVDGRVRSRPVERGQNVAAGQLLLTIENPELVAKLDEARAAKVSAEANLANVLAGVRPEEIAEREATVASAAANLQFAQQKYDRTKQLNERDLASRQKLQKMTASPDVATSSLTQAKFALAEAKAGATREQRAVAAGVKTLEAQVAELAVSAPVAAQRTADDGAGGQVCALCRAVPRPVRGRHGDPPSDLPSAVSRGSRADGGVDASLALSRDRPAKFGAAFPSGQGPFFPAASLLASARSFSSRRPSSVFGFWASETCVPPSVERPLPHSLPAGLRCRCPGFPLT
jgi:hypothetical protein